MAGSREKAWGKKKKFREGQADQVLDDLFFHFIETARILQPKIVIAENVKGLIVGKAKGYVKQINQMFNHAGYDVQLFLLNAAFMGVPQRRERTFFICKRRDLGLYKIDLRFNEKVRTVSVAWEGLQNQTAKKINNKELDAARKYCLAKNTVRVEDYFSNVKGFRKQWNTNCIMLDQVSPTICSSGTNIHPLETRSLSKLENFRIQSFPDDYNLLNLDSKYICGMSVPPFMMQRISNEVRLQWLDKL
jgi:DNA (cytosine-5)-methyltransferase 1